MKIRTTYENPPIPYRGLDWSAIDDNTYDGEGCHIGRSATKQEAILDLFERHDEEPCRALTNAAGPRDECLRCGAASGGTCQDSSLAEVE